MRTRFAILTDIHMGPPPYYKGCNRLMAGESERALGSVIPRVNAEEGLEFVIQLGDLVQDRPTAPSRDEDLESLARAMALLENLRPPLYHVLGNHCQTTLSVEDYRAAMKLPLPSYRFETDGFTHLVIYTAVDRGIEARPADLEWLRNELDRSTKPVLAYLHHPVIKRPLDHNFWFHDAPEGAFVRNGADVAEALTSSGKVRAVFNGHLHENHSLERSGVPFFTIQSLVEDVRMTGTPAESYAVVTVDDTSVSVVVKGRDPAEYRHLAPPAATPRKEGVVTQS